MSSSESSASIPVNAHPQSAPHTVCGDASQPHTTQLATSTCAAHDSGAMTMSAVQQRVAAHLAWKRDFFQARPPPRAMPQLHRRSHDRKGGAPTALLFTQARALMPHATHSTARTENANSVTAHHREERDSVRGHADSRLPYKARMHTSDATSNTTEARVRDDGDDSARTASVSDPSVLHSTHDPRRKATSSARSTIEGKTENDNTADPFMSHSLTQQAMWVQRMREERQRRNPFTDLHIVSDARCTGVMANLAPDTTEDELRLFAHQFGRVRHCRIVRNVRTKKSRGYGFVEFGLPSEVTKAVQHSRKRRLRGRLVTIDVERGRTQHNFLPQRMATARRYESKEKVNPVPAIDGEVGVRAGHDEDNAAVGSDVDSQTIGTKQSRANDVSAHAPCLTASPVCVGMPMKSSHRSNNSAHHDDPPSPGDGRVPVSGCAVSTSSSARKRQMTDALDAITSEMPADDDAFLSSLLNA